jgi:hypothetical protein
MSHTFSSVRCCQELAGRRERGIQFFGHLKLFDRLIILASEEVYCTHVIRCTIRNLAPKQKEAGPTRVNLEIMERT